VLKTDFYESDSPHVASNNAFSPSLKNNERPSQKYTFIPIFVELTQLYLDRATKVLAINKEINEKQVMKNFYPDTLPIELKRLVINNQNASTFVDRVFSDILKEQPIVSIETIKQILKRNKKLAMLSTSRPIKTRHAKDNPSPSSPSENIPDETEPNVTKTTKSRPEKYSPPPPVTSKTKQNINKSLKELTFDDMISIYTSIATKILDKKNVINTRDIRLHFHPDRLPLAIRTDIQSNKAHRLYIGRVFDSLNRRQSIESMKKFQNILNAHKRSFNSAFPTVVK
jgi:hypothetical protein